MSQSPQSPFVVNSLPPTVTTRGMSAANNNVFASAADLFGGDDEFTLSSDLTTETPSTSYYQQSMSPPQSSSYDHIGNIEPINDTTQLDHYFDQQHNANAQYNTQPTASPQPAQATPPLSLPTSPPPSSLDDEFASYFGMSDVDPFKVTNTQTYLQPALTPIPTPMPVSVSKRTPTAAPTHAYASTPALAPASLSTSFQPPRHLYHAPTPQIPEQPVSSARPFYVPPSATSMGSTISPAPSQLQANQKNQQTLPQQNAHSARPVSPAPPPYSVHNYQTQPLYTNGVASNSNTAPPYYYQPPINKQSALPQQHSRQQPTFQQPQAPPPINNIAQQNESTLSDVDLSDTPNQQESLPSDNVMRQQTSQHPPSQQHFQQQTQYDIQPQQQQSHMYQQQHQQQTVPTPSSYGSNRTYAPSTSSTNNVSLSSSASGSSIAFLPRSAHAIISFAFNGKMIITFPIKKQSFINTYRQTNDEIYEESNSNNNNNSSIPQTKYGAGSIRLYSISSYLLTNSYYLSLLSFPNILVTPTLNKSIINNVISKLTIFIQQNIDENVSIITESSTYQRLLWKLLLIMIKHIDNDTTTTTTKTGTFVNDVATMLLETLSSSSTSSSSNGLRASSNDEWLNTQNTISSSSSSNLSSPSQPSSSSDSYGLISMEKLSSHYSHHNTVADGIELIEQKQREESSLHRIDSLLIRAEYRNAINESLQSNLYTHAIIFAMSLSNTEELNMVLTRFANHSYPVGHPIHALITVQANQTATLLPTPQQLLTIVANNNTAVLPPVIQNWRACTAFIIRSLSAVQSRPFLLLLSDCLAVLNLTSAAHIAYLLTALPLDPYVTETARCVLIGYNHQRRSSVHASHVQMTCILEFVLAAAAVNNGSNTASNLIMPTLLPYKLLYAYQLIEVGLLDSALEMIESIQSAIKSLQSTARDGANKSLSSVVNPVLTYQVDVCEYHLRHTLNRYVSDGVSAKIVNSLFSALDKGINLLVGDGTAAASSSASSASRAPVFPVLSLFESELNAGSGTHKRSPSNSPAHQPQTANHMQNGSNFSLTQMPPANATSQSNGAYGSATKSVPPTPSPPMIQQPLNNPPTTLRPPNSTTNGIPNNAIIQAAPNTLPTLGQHFGLTTAPTKSSSTVANQPPAPVQQPVPAPAPSTSPTPSAPSNTETNGDGSENKNGVGFLGGLFSMFGPAKKVKEADLAQDNEFKFDEAQQKWICVDKDGREVKEPEPEATPPPPPPPPPPAAAQSQLPSSFPSASMGAPPSRPALPSMNGGVRPVATVRNRYALSAAAAEWNDSAATAAPAFIPAPIIPAPITTPLTPEHNADQAQANPTTTPVPAPAPSPFTRPPFVTQPPMTTPFANQYTQQQQQQQQQQPPTMMYTPGMQTAPAQTPYRPNMYAAPQQQQYQR